MFLELLIICSINYHFELWEFFHKYLIVRVDVVSHVDVWLPSPTHGWWRLVHVLATPLPCRLSPWLHKGNSQNQKHIWKYHTSTQRPVFSPTTHHIGEGHQQQSKVLLGPAIQLFPAPGALCGLGRVQVPVAQGDLQWERSNAGQHQDLIVNLTCPTIKILGVNGAVHSVHRGGD